MNNKILPPKGFRDFLPAEAKNRETVLNLIKSVFSLYGFLPLETPAIEYASTLLGKYGQEADKLIYQFKDRGEREVGLRYDLTVPLARVMASYPDLPLPFKRYQIQNVYRAEKPQKGRFREFLQCDIDTVGTGSYLADAEIICCTLEIFKKLGFKAAKILINDRTIFDDLKLSKQVIIILDKLAKIDQEKVLAELLSAGVNQPEELLLKLEKSEKTKRLQQIFDFLSKNGFKEGQDFQFNPFLARGLDYYTSTICEVVDPNYPAGSLAGGGRYDKLIGQFGGRDLPAVGISFGIDRIIEAITQLGIKLPRTSTQILVTVFSFQLLNESLKIDNQLTARNIRTEIYLDPAVKLDKQLKYADKKGIPYVVIIGPEEVKKGGFMVKDMKNKTQKLYTNLDELKASLN